MTKVCYLFSILALFISNLALANWSEQDGVFTNRDRRQELELVSIQGDFTAETLKISVTLRKKELIGQGSDRAENRRVKSRQHQIKHQLQVHGIESYSDPQDLYTVITEFPFESYDSAKTALDAFSNFETIADEDLNKMKERVNSLSYGAVGVSLADQSASEAPQPVPPGLGSDYNRVLHESLYDRLNHREHHYLREIEYTPVTDVNQLTENQRDHCCSSCRNLAVDILKERGRLVQFRCGHVMCQDECAPRWVYEKAQCPECRQDLLKKKD